MGKEKNIVKRIFAILFAAFLVLGFVMNCPNILDEDFTANLWKHKEFIDLNGFMAKTLHINGLYSDMGMYVTNDHYIVSASDCTSTDFEVQEVVDFRDFLEENGISLLYVNEPTKYTDDTLLLREFGIETYSNRNADLFLRRIREAGVNTIDLRDNLKEEGRDVTDLFYRTDHHWTVPTGLWASKIIAEGLRDYCGYEIDSSVFEEENYIRRDWTDSWLGEQGKKMGQSYVGLDDYTELKPAFETDYTFKNNDGTTYDGTFDEFVNESVYNTGKDVYDSKSWHYSYKNINCINNDVEHGKVLILGDSYARVTQSFLSLQVHEVDTLVLRRFEDDFSLREYILENGYDTVVIAYAQFMVGAHDDPDSDNYRMFILE